MTDPAVPVARRRTMSSRAFAARRSRWLSAAAVVLLAYVAVVSLVPTRFVTLSPGPTFNTIGEANGKPLISISGHPTYPTAGTIDMTTVSERGGPFGGAYVVQVLNGWRDPDVRVLPAQVLYPDDTPAAEVQQQNEEAFTGSQSSAVSAALAHLGIPAEVVVQSVAAGGPSVGLLRKGDQLVSIDGAAVTGSASLTELVRSHTAGETVTVGVVRDGKHQDVEVRLGTSPTSGKPYLGVVIAEEPPFTIDFTLDDVGGPSAGLAFTLGIIDKLTPGQLNGGKQVAVTGEISPDGQVGAIGGIAQKLAGARGSGAELFLAPKSNCDEVVGHVPDGLTVAAVSTVDDAITAMTDYAAGRPVAAC